MAETHKRTTPVTKPGVTETTPVAHVAPTGQRSESPLVPMTTGRQIVAGLTASERQTLRTRVKNENKEVGEYVTAYVRALLRWKDAIVGSRSQTSLRGTSPRTRVDTVRQTQRNGVEYVSNTGGLTMILVIDSSASLDEESYSDWSRQSQNPKKYSRIAAEDNFVALNSLAFKQLAANGTAFNSQEVLFGLFTGAPGLHGGYGREAAGIRNYLAKEIKTLGSGFIDEDEDAVMLILRDDEYREGPSNVTPALQIVEDAIRADSSLMARMQNNQEAVIVLIATDGELHDEGEAKKEVKALRNMGVRVVGINIDPRGNHPDRLPNITNEDGGANHTYYPENPQQLIDAINNEAAREERRNGVTTSRRNTSPINGTGVPGTHPRTRIN